jgi:RNA polymerase sigma-70 factor (ECF subfamily)
MLNNETEAEDMLQNSFMDVFSKLHYFRFESSIGAWIKRIVINNCINFLKKKRLQVVEMGDRDIPTSDSADDWKDTEFSVAQINDAIQALPDGYRIVVNLYLLEGYDHQEIGEIMGISSSTSKSQYSRAKKKLREALRNNKRMIG